ncbi:MAG: glycoside hydrolase domain-containing protein, partial [Bdellovibrionota bacterium]
TSAPWKTQALTRRILSSLFVGKETWPGQDDLGSLSAWGIWAALGLYPAIPGVGGLVSSSPIFPAAVLHLGNGKQLTVSSSGEGPFVQSLRINGKTWASTFVGLEALAGAASEIHFELGASPGAWGTPPPSFGDGD